MAHRGWHHRGYLPHYDSYDIAQHIVFCLADAVPHDAPDGGDDILDRGHGIAIFRNAACARVMAEALLHFDGTRYGLRGWCVMPNHVHALIMMTKGNALTPIVHSWKSFTAKKINTMTGRTGRLWAPDYFDRFIRDIDHYTTTMRYIEHNPVAAGLCERPEDWLWSSAGWKPQAYRD